MRSLTFGQWFGLIGSCAGFGIAVQGFLNSLSGLNDIAPGMWGFNGCMSMAMAIRYATYRVDTK